MCANVMCAHVHVGYLGYMGTTYVLPENGDIALLPGDGTTLKENRENTQRVDNNTGRSLVIMISSGTISYSSFNSNSCGLTYLY